MIVLIRQYIVMFLQPNITSFAGCEQFSEYEGYADTFRWKNDFQDKTERYN